MGRRLGSSPAPTALALAALSLWAAACASTPSGPEVVHVVRPEENLYRISLHYGVSVQDLVRANDIDDVRDLEVGQRLRVPGTRRPPSDAPLVPPVALGAPERSGEPSAGDREVPVAAREVVVRDTTLRFQWPIAGKVSSPFGRRGRSHHEGIDIPARAGTQVLAAESGRVVHSGAKLGRYGNVVIVKHAGPFATVYAHNRRNLVRMGEFVEKGQPIAQVGDSGNASAPHLHFEIRRGQRPQDPMLYLP